MPFRTDVPSRAERLVRLQRLLEGEPGAASWYLAWRLGVSRRSIMRDIAYLRGLGHSVPVVRGNEGGIKAIGGPDLDDETIVTLISLEIAAQLGLPFFTDSAERLRRRREQDFPTLHRRIIMAKPQTGPHQEPDPAAMRQLQIAFARQYTIMATYRDNDVVPSAYTIEPHVLVICWPIWYLLGYDCRSQTARMFRLDRFVTVRPLRLRRFYAR